LTARGAGARHSRPRRRERKRELADYGYPVSDYGAIAKARWREFLPWRYAAAGDDPDAFFDALGAEVSREISDLWGQMTSRHGNPPGEDFTERGQRLNAMRKQAEEIVLADRVLLPPELGVPEQRPA
jgi:hypothetical protein